MVETAPSSPFEMPEPDLLLELLIVALDAPAQLGEIYQVAESDILRKRREPIFCRLGLTFRPLDQQPFFRAALGETVVAMGDTDAYPGKARGQLFGGACAPRDRAPGFGRQAEGKLLDRDRLMIA